MLKALKLFIKFFVITHVLFTLAILPIGISVVNYAEYYNDGPADVAIVLGFPPKDSLPAPLYEERLNQAVNLFEAGRVEYIILTGGKGNKYGIHEAEVGFNYLVKQGLPASKLLIEDSSTTTYENLVNARLVMEQNNLNSALIVSDPYHMKRALAMSDYLEMNAQPSPTQTSLARPWYGDVGHAAYEAVSIVVAWFKGEV